MGNCNCSKKITDNKSETDVEDPHSEDDSDDDRDDYVHGGVIRKTRRKQHDVSKLSKVQLASLGVSVHCLRYVFLKEVLEAGLDESANIYEIENLNRDLDENDSLDTNATSVITPEDEAGQHKHEHENNTNICLTRQRGKDVMCPINGKLGAAYVHSLDYYEDYVGKANSMLSYSSEHSIGEILDALKSYCESNGLDQKKTYIWIGCLCFHHRLDGSQPSSTYSDEFQNTVQDRITGIGHMLAMAPYDKLMHLSRMWCLFELYLANDAGCIVTMIIPPKEKQILADALIKWGQDRGEEPEGDPYALLADAIEVEKTYASEATDHSLILEAIRNGPGYERFNEQVNEIIQEWVTMFISEIVDERIKKNCRKESLDVDCVSFIDRMGGMFHSNGQFDRALEMHKETLTIRETALGISHKDVATSYNNIGTVLQSKGDLDNALSFYKTAFVIQKAAVGEHHKNTADTYNLMGSVLYDQENMDGALLMYQKAMTVYEVSFGTDHPDTAATYNNIGSILRSKQKLDEALIMHKRALQVYKVIETNPEKSLSLATTYGNIGFDLQCMGKYDDSLAMHYEALGIQESILGSNHEVTATSYTHIAFVLQSKELLDEALPMFEKAVSAYQTACGPRHPSTACSYNNIGSALQSKGELDRALNMFETALSIYEEAFGVEHPDSAASFVNVGSVLYELGKFDLSLSMVDKAHSFYFVNYGPFHPDTRHTQNFCKHVIDRCDQK